MVTGLVAGGLVGIGSRAAPAGAAAPSRRGGSFPDASPAPLPAPRPAAVDASGTVSVFPTPGTPDVSATTGITFRGPGIATLTTITATGSQSGAHAGHFQPDTDGAGTTFVPDSAFAPGEHVTVTAPAAVRGATNGAFAYDVARPAPVKSPPPAVPKGSTANAAGDVMHFVTRPDLQPPKLTVSKTADGTAPGDVFLTPSGGVVQHGPLIVDDEGQPIWFDPVPTAHTIDLQVQQYQGRPVLTWFEGSLGAAGYGNGDVVIADTSYHEIARVHAADGYQADLHDFEITPAGTALFTIYDPVYVDASSVGGGKNRPVLDAVIQEVDIATGALRFEWHSLGTIALTESYVAPPKQPGLVYDYVHPNSVALDLDGNLLVSGRHTWAIYKLDRTSGALDWRLGGKRNNFTQGENSTVAWQHDVRRLPDGTLTVFDNGARSATRTHKFSRGVVLAVDDQTRAASLKFAYEASKPVSAGSQGSFQQLPNGDFFAGWGDQPEYTEFAPDGSVLLDVHLPGANPARTVNSYRAYRFTWSATAPGTPVMAAIRGKRSDDLTVYASWNGATNVAAWTVLAGPDRQHLTPLTTAPKHGFETAVHVVSNQPYFAVRATDAAGATLATSPPVTPRA